ncbi:MAG: hypothetical protein KatS3mg111_4152 [Pirellulaceae bacterium]|nr:MAG: hypothetical protein KatS3mg111_4152 [Pirellulaceae bacterium]
MHRHLTRLARWWDRFLFHSCSPGTCVVLRIGYAILLLICTYSWWLDGPFWFSNEGVMSPQTARALTGGRTWSLLGAIDASPAVVQVGLSALLAHGLALLLGIGSRFQALMIFLWLVTFHHRNPLILDGQDTLFRLFAFYLMWMPLDARWSVGRWWFSGTVTDDPDQLRPAAWGLRLLQMQMVWLYISAAWSKLLGEPWRDGTALFYVAQMGDLYGRGWWPELLLRNEMILRYGTWAVVLAEAILPLLLMVRRTRGVGVAVGILLHLSMEYSMHLFLFQWMMILGLLSFLNFDRLVFGTARLTCFASR